jgi:hypothetical protein
MNVQTFLLKLGVPTYIYSVVTELSGSIQEKIGDTMEVTVGWVYGLSVNLEGTLATEAAKTNIVSADALKLFLNLKYAQSIYLNQLRLNHLCFDDVSVPATPKFTSEQKYLPVNIPIGTDLKQSYYSNPSLLTAPKNVTLNLFYIDKVSYIELLKQKLILSNGRPVNMDSLPKELR